MFVEYILNDDVFDLVSNDDLRFLLLIYAILAAVDSSGVLQVQATPRNSCFFGGWLGKRLSVYLVTFYYSILLGKSLNQIKTKETKHSTNVQFLAPFG